MASPGAAAVARPPRPWKRAALWLALLGPFFYLSYGFANAMAARRADVPSVVFDWEHAIPFWAWTIVPYWTTNAFYAASLFLCRDRVEVDTLGRRLLTVQLLAVACFLSWPLAYSFQRPETHGLLGAMFDALSGFDKPFNQAPSLHVALTTILWVHYVKFLHGPWRIALHAWFTLVTFSILTTYQHHFIDLPTGLAAGWLVVWLWPEGISAPWRGARWTRDPRRWRLAGTYLLGALASFAVARVLGGTALWLCWPALSLALVAANYALLGTNGFQKRRDGRLSMAARWLYAPYLVGAWLNSRLWTRRLPAAVPVVDGVWLGRIPSASERDGFHVVDVCAELSLPGAAGEHDRVVPMLDLVAPTSGQLDEAVTAMDAARASGRPVLVCCALGYSRSAAAIVAWLLAHGMAAGIDAAIAIVAKARPRIVLRERHRQAIVSWQFSRRRQGGKGRPEAGSGGFDTDCRTGEER